MRIQRDSGADIRGVYPASVKSCLSYRHVGIKAISDARVGAGLNGNGRVPRFLLGLRNE